MSSIYSVLSSGGLYRQNLIEGSRGVGSQGDWTTFLAGRDARRESQGRCQAHAKWPAEHRASEASRRQIFTERLLCAQPALELQGQGLGA